MRTAHNIFACLVHESEECIVDLVRNLRALDPASSVLLYNGSGNPELLDNGFPFTRYNVKLHPSSRPVSWGRLHDFAIDCMEFALETDEFDTITIVDSDQLCVRPGYSDYLFHFLADQSRVGVMSNSPGVQSPSTNFGPFIAAFQEVELWRTFLQRFPEGEQKFVHWSFWPSTVFTADAARDIVNLFRDDQQLREIMTRTRIWASEEVVLPTLTALLGYEVALNPCSYEYVRYRVPYSLAEADVALTRPNVFWLHPVPRRYSDPLRAHIRRRHHQYERAIPKRTPILSNRTPEPPLLLISPILARMRAIEGWLADEEADLLIAALLRAILALKDKRAIVEVGSYCGRSTVILGSVIQALRPENARVYAVDPHDGKLGALDQGIQQVTPSLDKFQSNLAAAGLQDFVEPICSQAFDVQWDKPVCFLLVDGLHDYMNVARDFYHFEPWVTVGGYIAFHDYANYYPGVVTFVNEILTNGCYERVGCAGSLIVIRKTAETNRSEETEAKPLVSCLMTTADRCIFVQ